MVDLRQVRVVFQPIVDLATCTPFGYEVLARSTSPCFQTPPQMFEAAAQQGLCGKLGRVIREAAIEAAPDCALFVNVHPLELTEPLLVQPVDPLFQHPYEIYLEITESAPLTHFELCRSVLREIQDRGVHLVIDDLGAGYSNLKYIADLAPRVVKLDGALVRDMATSARTQRLVFSIVVLCHNLGAVVVAEGIETTQQLSAVMDAGVPYGQGYLLARPALPPPEVQWPVGIDAAPPIKTIPAPPVSERPPRSSRKWRLG